MKKILSFMLVAALAMPMFAQEQPAASEKSDYTPSKGDFAIGFNLNPFATFVGQLANGTVGNAIDNSLIGGEAYGRTSMYIPTIYPVVSIQGKYMLTDNLGIRANIGLLLGRKNQKEYVQDDLAKALDPLSHAKLVDGVGISSTGGSLTAGVEYRLGKRRVQAVFGGSLLYAFSTYNETYRYANQITDINQIPTIASFSGYKAFDGIPNARPTQLYSQQGFHTVGVVGSIGIEGFVAPKISIGAEVNLALLYTWSPQTWEKFEGYNVVNERVENWTELVAPKQSEFHFGTENIGANLFMCFYFD